MTYKYKKNPTTFMHNTLFKAFGKLSGMIKVLLLLLLLVVVVVIIAVAKIVVVEY